MNDLAAPTDLSGMAGAPFTDAEVDSAVSILRGVLGWHVAPSQQTTVVRDFSCTRWRLLPTRHLTSVDSVTSTETSADLSYWAPQIEPSRVVLDDRAPGHGEVSITMTHGFDECPQDLLPVIAEFARAGRDGGQSLRATAMTSGPYTTQFAAYEANASEAHPTSTAAVLSRYAAFDVGFA